MSVLPITTRFTRGCLPHWEVSMGRYFITVRCHDSLPREITAGLLEIERELARTPPRSRQFALLQRRYFVTAEKYADAGYGSSPLASDSAAQILAESFSTLSGDGVEVPHFSIMPNHWHALFVPLYGSVNLHAVMTRFKGRTARDINRTMGRSGPLWQREWFDHWIRDETEWARCAQYVRDNPVKAGLVKNWRDHRWTR